MTDPITPDAVRRAIERVVEYLHEERAYYEAIIEEGGRSENHIYHAVRTLETWVAVERHPGDELRLVRPFRACEAEELALEHCRGLERCGV